jgi:dienelactone hydrolase
VTARLLWLLSGVLCIGICRPAIAVSSQEISLPSAIHTGNLALDTIWVRYFPSGAVGDSPAVVLIPPVGSDERDDLMRRYATYLAQKGIACAVIDLPYHGKRAISQELPSYYFAGGTIPGVIQAFTQSASDVETVAHWLMLQPGIDPRRIGVVGVSLGAIVAHLAMGWDPNLTDGVAALGGGDLPYLYRHSLVSLYWKWEGQQHLGSSSLSELSVIDPLTDANQNRPRRVLMIEAARDLLVPPQDALVLWRALGKPPIQWIDTNHFALLLDPVSLFRATAAYLWGVWDGLPDSQISVPRVWAPTLKFGFLDQSGVGIDPAVQWQFLTLLSRPDHMSLLSLNIGLTPRGLFSGIAVTVTPFVDIGLAPDTVGAALRPYLSLYVVY